MTLVQVEIEKIVNTSLKASTIGFLSAFFVVAAAWVAICAISNTPTSHALVQFFALSLVMVLATAACLWFFHYKQLRMPLLWIVLSACLLRLVSLGGTPLFEDDYYRYLWDGYQTVETGDPYSLAPAEFFDRDVPEIFEPILSLINYPEIATVYGPVNEWLFAIGYLIAPAEVWPLQLMSSIADVLIMLILIKLGASNALLLYAWSPLILKETSLTAHPDVFAILGVMLAIWAAIAGKRFIAGVMMAVAVGTKVFAVLALPYLLAKLLPIKPWFIVGLGFVAGLASITASFGTLTIWVPEGLTAMADSWLFNAPLYLLLLKVIGFTQIKLVLLGLFTLSILASIGYRTWVAKDASQIFRGDWLFGVFLLCLPVLNPWYVLWVMPFAVLFPSWWAWSSSFAVLLSYWQSLKAPVNTSDFFQSAESVVLVEVMIILIVSIAGQSLWKALACKKPTLHHST